jgi:hypothetical protein
MSGSSTLKRDPQGKLGAIANCIRDEIERFAHECHGPLTEYQKNPFHQLGKMLKEAKENEKGPRGEPLDPSAT